ncbi:MAG: DUF5615 family PIN-like protein [Candidatus Devosia phytovorans]|uniref:DUF5615 family PIN-like protein n=1 Tax=Candidatus Devosia phytovorans TaxID=3121372 RepID=A0AAJ6AZX3_9HYPH|nr:DUF5615 family PIN-like protein [Devosia sp.]WEK03579.1 MAG: DUF5615 family PIN-like protein [Devosia sp.]
MRFIVDMNMSAKWVLALQQAGYDARHWSSIGSSKAPDSDIAAMARAEDAIVLTRDLDFSAIVATTHLEKPSVIHLRDKDRFDEATVARLLMTIKAFETLLRSGAILTIAGNRARIRPLPVSERPQK